MRFSDSHTDFITKVKGKSEREKYIQSIIENGGDNISFAIFTTHEKYTLSDVENYRKEIDYYNQKYDKNFLLSIEDIGVFEPNELDLLIKNNMVSASLTWNDGNIYAGGAQTDTGLTEKGKNAVKLFEKNGVFVDCAHESYQTFDDFEKITTKPLYVSHANIYSLFAHPRNLKDEQIKRIVSSNGFIGLTFYQKFISENKISTLDIAKQYAYFIEKYGDKNIGLGTDLYGIDKDFLPSDFKGYSDSNKLINSFQKIGFNEKIIENILWKNYFEFLNRNNIKK